ncbi:hypothetical protein [uncultured Roseobacter sp.]|uniref:hypothetical protein n=1 Tax=uncultured Roseobacter sp. TaxID=114847 RepID=UPI00261C2B14|nr:hypothetical protein [uncultured Roseobacter sp.]
MTDRDNVRALVGDIISENRSKVSDPEWADHVVSELRGMPVNLVQYALLAAIMRDAADLIEHLKSRKE